MRLSRTDLLPVLTIVALSLVSAEGVAAKCSQMAWPGLERGVPVFIVDGSIMVPEMRAGNEAPALGGRVEGPAPLPRAQSGSAINIRPFDFDLPDAIDDPSDIHSLEITCWNPKTGEIGGGGGVNVIRILTKSFVESTRAPIEALLRAQEAYFSQHSRYAQSLDDLVGFGVPRDAMLEFPRRLQGGLPRHHEMTPTTAASSTRATPRRNLPERRRTRSSARPKVRKPVVRCERCTKPQVRGG